MTVVVEEMQGNRVRNLIAETQLNAGKMALDWDGYDEGIRSRRGDDAWIRQITRHRVAPGTHKVRALVHDHLALSYEFSVNSPGTPPWKTGDGTGAWLADHNPAADAIYLPQGAKAPNGKGPVRFLIWVRSAFTPWMNSASLRIHSGIGSAIGFSPRAGASKRVVTTLLWASAMTSLST